MFSMQEQKLLEDPLFFLAQHPEKKIQLHFLGIAHAEMQYPQLPTWCRKKINAMELLFHEGSGPVVFTDPFSVPFPLYYFIPKLHYNWFDKLDEDEQATVQKVMNLYCKNVKGSHFPIPSVHEMRFWCINKLVNHFEYFNNGQGIDYILHNHFSDNQKRVISLDTPNSAFSKNHMWCALQDEFQSLKNKHNPIPTLKKQLQNIKTYFETGNYVEYIEEDDSDDNVDFPAFAYSNFHYFIENANDFAIEMPPNIPGRNIEWLKIIEETIASRQSGDKDAQSLVLSGLAHLPDLFARLMFKGFTISHVTENQLLPLEQHTLDLIHSYRVYHETFQNLKSEIIGESYVPIDWLRKIKVTQEQKEQQEACSSNSNKPNQLVCIQQKPQTR